MEAHTIITNETVAQIVELGNAAELTLGAGQVGWETSRPRD